MKFRASRSLQILEGAREISSRLFSFKSMPRARNIKPSFFVNEDLVELPFSTRLLFIGLWTLADREGRLGDKPKQIKMAIFPADDVDVNSGLTELEQSGFILRYEMKCGKYIQILNFNKHQSPHVKEVASTIPAPVKHRASTRQAALIPDSPFLNPESKTDSGLRIVGSAETHSPDDFTFPIRPLIEAFPSMTLTPSAIGFIEGAVKPEDEVAWRKTILIYQQNFDPFTKSYLPEKTGNLLGVFEREKAALENKNGSNQTSSGSRKPTSLDRIANTQRVIEQYPTEAELRGQS